MADNKVGTAATRAKNKWQTNNCDRINLVVPKGYKEHIKITANKIGDSLNGYIKKAIDEKIERDNSSSTANSTLKE